MSEELVRLLVGSEERQEKNRRAWQSIKTAAACGVCGEPLSPDEPMYRTRTRVSGAFGLSRWQINVCESCAPAYLKRDDGWPVYTIYCHTCERPVRGSWHNLRAQRFFCCERCEWQHYNEIEKERRATQREHTTCRQCGATFEAARADAAYCSPACRQKAYRARKRE